jgi:hypothetical protein
MSVIRSGFSGENLGYTYRGRSKEVVRAHTYRMTMLVSVQPDRAGALFDDTGGGTPQRFQWFVGRDRRIRGDADLWPMTKQGRLRGIPLISRADLCRAAGIISIPDEACDTIRAARAASMSGDDNALDGHALYCREKFAFGLALIEGRTHITDEDWKLSGIATDVSNWTREGVQRKLATAEAEAARRRGALMGITRAASDLSGKQERGATDERVLRWILKKLEKIQGKRMTQAELYRGAASRDRHLIEGAVTHGIVLGVLRKVDGQVIIA